MNRQADADEDDEDIGVLIYQHAKREAEKSAAAAANPALAHRRSAGIKQATAPTKAAATQESSIPSRQSAYTTRTTNPINLKTYTLDESKERSSSLTRYNELVDYKRQFGNCNVPARYKSNPQLGTWVVNQRKRFKNKSLSEDLIIKLNRIGFSWEINREDDWMTRFNQLVNYKREFGNCNVPSRYKSNTHLGKWVDHQRQHFKRKSLSKDRIEKLNRIGFAWEINRDMEDAWLTRYNQLVEYKHEFGSCHVPQRYKLNPGLGYWVYDQRKLFKKKSLSQDRVKKLNSIGFIWKF